VPVATLSRERLDDRNKVPGNQQEVMIEDTNKFEQSVETRNDFARLDA